MVKRIPSSGTRSKLNATKGQVASVAAKEITAAAVTHLSNSTDQGLRHQEFEGTRLTTLATTAFCTGNARAIPAMAAKLSWKETW